MGDGITLGFGYTPVSLYTSLPALRLLVPKKLWLDYGQLNDGVRVISQKRKNNVTSLGLQYPVIAWEYDGQEDSADVAAGNTSARTCLDEFIELQTATDEAVLGFVKKWGVLDFCKWASDYVLEGYGSVNRYAKISELESEIDFREALDSTYTFTEWQIDRRLLRYWQSEHREEEAVFQVLSEPVETYRIHAQQVAAMIRIAAGLNHGELGSSDDWHTAQFIDNPKLNVIMDGMGAKHEPPPSPPQQVRQALPPNDLSAQKWWLSEIVNEWMRRAQVRPMLFWGRSEHAEIGLDENGPFSHARSVSVKRLLALQLATTIGGRFYRCPICRRWIAVKPDERKPREGKPCDDRTCKSEAVSRRVKRHREKKKGIEAT